MTEFDNRMSPAFKRITSLMISRTLYDERCDLLAPIDPDYLRDWIMALTMGGEMNR